MRDLARRPFRSALVAAGMVAACLFGVPALAAQTGGAGAASTAAATADRNVYAGGGQVRPPVPVNGDFTAAGGKVIVDQPVAGDASLAGGSVDVRAPVGDDVRAVGGDISIESTVGGELFATGGNITFTRSAAVGRGATFYGGSVSVEGRVDGDLRATARKVIIDGEVRGNARLVAEEIELGPKARIGGGLSYVSKSELKKAEGATIVGAVTREQEGASRRGPGGNREWEGSVQGPSWVAGVMSFLALLAVAAIFLLMVPSFGALASDRIRSSPWLALGVGFGTVVAVPVLAVLLFVTLLGIPLGIALMALYPALMLVGFVVGVLFIGRLLAAALRKEAPRSFAASLGYSAIGLLVTLLVASVPFVGVPLAGLLSLAGVGACVLELYGRRAGPTQSEAGPSPDRPPKRADAAATV
jgi:cytoskeletal protein CcmA (bactofilin family)